MIRAEIPYTLPQGPDGYHVPKLWLLLYRVYSLIHNLQQVLIAHGIADICLPNNVTALPLARVLDTTHRTRRHCFYSLPPCMKHPLMTKTHWGESSRNHPCPLKPDLPQGAVARAKARVRAGVRAKATARVRANAGG